jgi:diacylglycerol kinase family enzyme
MAGGDGSQALVASVASRRGIPHVVVPAGTRNHFALDLGLDRDDVLGALSAYDDGVDRVIDLADVNGRVFVNNASLGAYAKVVQSSDYRDAKMQTFAAMLPDLLGPDAIPLDLQFTLPSGEEATSAVLILVSNNQYELHHFSGGGSRARIDDGVLGIVCVRVGSNGMQEWTATQFEVRSGRPVEIGIDGEALRMEPPLRFSIRPGALTVRVPRSAPGRSPAAMIVRLASGSTIAALCRVALGRAEESG